MFHLFKNIYRFYLEGFRSMTIGKTLWIIILIKLFIIFIVLKPFFFKSELSDYKNTQDKSKYVIEHLTPKTIL